MSSIYIHIPFCKQACNYCNFYFVTTQSQKDLFINNLLLEIEKTKDYLPNKKLETLYFGGGTPSLLTLFDFEKIIKTLQKFYDLSALQEFTIEANPDDLSASKLVDFKEMKNWGLNRFSIGVQSFLEADLQYMKRAHTSQEAQASIARALDNGFEKLSVDLIYGTPTLTESDWQKNMEIALKSGANHLSAYALTVEPKTKLAKQIKEKLTPPVLEEKVARQMEMLFDFLPKNEFEQYEISNFAKNEQYAVHNTNYWKSKPYLGLGPSAHSFNKTSRRWNVANLQQYNQRISEQKQLCTEEILTPTQQLNERILIGLRTKWGLDLRQLDSFESKVKKELEIIPKSHYFIKDDKMILTAEGKQFADFIASSLFVDEK